MATVAPAPRSDTDYKALAATGTPADDNHLAVRRHELDPADWAFTHIPADYGVSNATGLPPTTES